MFNRFLSKHFSSFLNIFVVYFSGYMKLNTIGNGYSYAANFYYMYQELHWWNAIFLCRTYDWNGNRVSFNININGPQRSEYLK